MVTCLLTEQSRLQEYYQITVIQQKIMSTNKRDHPDAPPPAYSLHQHACITMNSSDCFRLIQFPPAIIDIVREAIITSWPRGLQREGDYSGAYEFKLHGDPWWGQGDEAVSSRILMFHVLSSLYNRGWHLLASADISKKQLDKDSLIFQHGIVPPRTTFFAVSFNESDKLRLIGMPPELIPAVQQSLNPADIQRAEWLYEGVAYEFKLRGNPWFGGGKEGIYARIKLLSLLNCLTSFGWKLYASIDMSKGHEGSDTDTMIFRQDIS